MAYNVKTANIYDNLPDEDAENVQNVEVPAKQAAAKAKEADKIMPSVAAGVEARMKGNANGPQSGGGRTRQEGRGRGGGRGIRQGTDQPSRAETGDVDVGGAGERNSRGRIPRGKDLGKRHEHDRFDGTGRGHETEKREGGGKGNWGTIDEEIQAQEADVNEVKGAAADPATDEPAEVPVGAEAVEPPKEEKEMTLEEFEKLREEKRAGLNKKPSSDVKTDPKAFEGMKAYSRSTGEEENGLELSNKKQIGQRKSGLVEKTRKEKELLETGFRVGQQETGRGGRGRGFDRGGRRDDRPGRGDRGGDRGDRGERVDRGDREDRPPRRSESGGQNGSREGGRGGRGEGGRGGRGEGGRGGRGEGGRGGRGEGGRGGRGEGGRGRGGFGRGDRPFGGRGRGRDGSAPAIDDASAFPTLGGNGA